MRHAEPNLLHAYCWYAVRRRPDWSAWASLVSSAEVLGTSRMGDWSPMRTGDCSVTVYFTWIAAAANPSAVASRSMRPKERSPIRSGVDRLVLRRLVVLLLDGGRCTTLPPDY